MKFIKTKRILYDEVTLFRLKIPRLLVLAEGTLQNLTNIYNFKNVTSKKLFKALSWHEDHSYHYNQYSSHHRNSIKMDDIRVESQRKLTESLEAHR